jgi:SAM-dependent methyltransferase
MNSDSFINIKINSKNIDIYTVRISILKTLRSKLHVFSNRMLDIGCGKMPYRKLILDESKVTEYVGLDIENALEYDGLIKPDFIWDGNRMPFDDNSFDCAIGTEVLEHCPNPEKIMKEVHRILKNDGVFFFTVPFLWNLHEVPNDEYRYTPFSLERHLKASGFNRIEISAMGGWHASLAQMIGLWVRRSPIGSFKRELLSVLFKQVIKKLIKMDLRHKVEFTEGQMITGLYGTAYKYIAQ